MAARRTIVAVSICIAGAFSQACAYNASCERFYYFEDNACARNDVLDVRDAASEISDAPEAAAPTDAADALFPADTDD